MTRSEEAALKAYPYEGGVKGLICEQSREIFIKGYEQAEKDLGWHSVEESLPEIDEEVIALTNDVRGHILPTASRLCFAHRPNPDGYYAKSTLTGRKTHYAAETYGEGGWNIPGVKFWMPCHKLPDEK